VNVVLSNGLRSVIGGICLRVLVRLGREVVPDVPLHGVRAGGAGGVRSDDVDRVRPLVAEEVVGEESGVLRHLVDEPRRPGLGAGIDLGWRLNAGVALRAVLGEDDLAAIEDGLIRSLISRTAGASFSSSGWAT